MKYKASLIISIYDNVSFLKVVLDSLMYQTEKITKLLFQRMRSFQRLQNLYVLIHFETIISI